MNDDLCAFLRARLDEDEAVARGAMWDDGPSAAWTARPPRDRYERYTVADYCDDGVVVVTPENADDDGVGQFIAANDPAAVLRRIAADRKQLKLHDAVPDHGRFSERGCDADCDREHDEPPVCRSCRDHAGDPIEAPCPSVENLAEGWGWTGETT